MTHITTSSEISTTSSTVIVESVHRSATAAQRTGRTTLRLVDGAFGGRSPRKGETLGLYRENTGVYAVRPR